MESLVMVASQIRRRAVLLATPFVLIAAGACDDGGGGSSSVATQAPPVTVSDETQNVGIPVAEDDGFVTLRGHLFGPNNTTGVILTHMRPNDQRDWFEFAEELADNGYAALTFDFRGYGETGGEQDFEKLDDDVLEAVRYMYEDRGMDQVFIVGASMGGTAGLVAAAERPVEGVVGISPPAEFEGLNAIDAVSSIPDPKLLIAAEDDTEAIGFQDLVDAASDPIETQTYTGNAHGTNLLQSEHGPALRARILQFLDEHSGAAAA
jgi:pimeloyl-ACP methyl ester carboxylesterase